MSLFLQLSSPARTSSRLLAVLAVLGLLLVSTPAPASARPEPPDHEDTAGILLSLIDHERAKRGLRPLRLDRKLAEAATDWSVRMARRGRMHHSPGRIPANATRLLENVGYSERREAGRHIHSMLMASPRHRAAILNPHITTYGVGAVEHRGVIWVTQRFTNAPTGR